MDVYNDGEKQNKKDGIQKNYSLPQQEPIQSTQSIKDKDLPLMWFPNSKPCIHGNATQPFGHSWYLPWKITEIEQWIKKERKIKLGGSNYYLFTDKYQA